MVHFILVPECYIWDTSSWYLTYLPYYINGYISSPIKDVYQIGDVYTVSCDAGSHVYAGTAQRTCEYDYTRARTFGYWTGLTPVCLKTGKLSHNVIDGHSKGCHQTAIENGYGVCVLRLYLQLWVDWNNGLHICARRPSCPRFARPVQRVGKAVVSV